jgi:hypothetical protein
MKTITNSLGVLMVAILLGGTPADLQAQGKSRGNGNDNNPGRGHSKESNPDKGHDKDYDKGNDHDRDFNSGDHRGRGNDNDYDRRRGHDQRYGDRDRNNGNHNYPSWDNYRYQRYDDHHRYVAYRHHRHGRPSWAPAYGYRYNTRYIYYQDYNVYYDCHRDVFVVWTGRNWTVSTRVPDAMFRVNFGRARVSGVDYWDDDFDFYLERRRPAYMSITAAW